MSAEFLTRLGAGGHAIVRFAYVWMFVAGIVNMGANTLVALHFLGTKLSQD